MCKGVCNHNSKYAISPRNIGEMKDLVSEYLQ
jgi:hypothetical protein